MKSLQLQPLSALAGAGIAAIAFLAMGQNPAASAAKWHYKVESDASADEIERLNAEGWEYVGYLGQGTKGVSNDETLWRQRAK